MCSATESEDVKILDHSVNGMPTPAAASAKKTKYYCFTLNNYTDAEEAELRALIPDQARYLCYGKEVSESGTPHLQGYIEFINRKTLRGCVRLCPRGSFFRRRGTAVEAKTYCEKENDFHEFGEWNPQTPGRRNDLAEIQTLIETGSDEKSIADEYFQQWVIYRRSFKRYRELCTPPRSRPELQCVLLWGESGVGKSSYVCSRFPDAWISSDPVLQWFDGYDGQSTVLIDDFTGECPFRFLLRILDIYRLRVPVKGGFVAFNPTRIFITSNLDVDDWYHGERDTTPIRRRLAFNQCVSERLGDTIPERHAHLDGLFGIEYNQE